MLSCCFLIRNTFTLGLAGAMLTLTTLAFRLEAQTLYVGNAGTSPKIEAFTSTGVGSVFATNSVFGFQGLAFDSHGVLFAQDSGSQASSGNYNIERFNTSGSNLGVFGHINYGDTPRGIAFDSAGNLYVANSSNNVNNPSTIIKFTPGGARTIFAQTSTGLSGPYGLAFDAAGNLYVANTLGNFIERFSSTGVDLGIFAKGGLIENPLGLAFDKAGNLYVANNQTGTGGNSIIKITPTGVQSTFANTLINGAYGIAFDPTGNLYVANNGNNTVARFTPTGVGSIFANTGLNHPTFLTFGPSVVPEPGTLALLTGLGLTSFLTLRRQRQNR